MSDVASRAAVNLLLADFASVDAGGKLNIIGAGVDTLGFDPAQGTTTRFTFVAQVSIPASMCPTEFAVEVALLDASGGIAELPSPAGTQKMRVAHVVPMEKPALPVGVTASRDDLTTRSNMVLDFSNGLPLVPGGVYKWRLQIDGDDSVEHVYTMAVAGPPAGPVIG